MPSNVSKSVYCENNCLSTRLTALCLQKSALDPPKSGCG